MRFIFGQWVLDTELFELSGQGVRVPIEPQVFDVLAHLITHRERIVGRDELLAALWRGKVVSESTLTSCIKAARQAIGDDGNAQKLIATVRGRGYRFVAPVEVMSTDSASPPPSPKRSRASLAVMPFEHAQDDVRAAWTAAMLGQDLSIHLARIPGFIVVSQNSTAQYSRRRPPASTIAQELDTDYLIVGSLWQEPDSLRISAQLLDAPSGRILWADSTVVSMSGLDGFQNEVIHQVASRIEPALNRAELATLRHRCPSDLGAWALYRQATALLGLKGWSEGTFAEAADLLRLAVKRAPDLAFAHAYHALLLAIGHLVGLVNNEGWHEEAVAAAELALELDNQDSDVLGYVGCAYADMGDLSRGIELMRRAIELNPSNAQARVGLGAALLLQGREEGVEMMRYGMRLSPRDSRLGIWGALLARQLLNLGRVEEAIEAAERACRCDDKIFLARLVLAIAQNAANNPERARNALAGARRLRPQLCEADIARFASTDELTALGQVGLPLPQPPSS